MRDLLELEAKNLGNPVVSLDNATWAASSPLFATPVEGADANGGAGAGAGAGGSPVADRTHGGGAIVFRGAQPLYEQCPGGLYVMPACLPCEQRGSHNSARG